ncbi:hypothetical protein SVAN01_07002 [Stagonosporopsis vannaccii]|nr:hypothetical protein SVAN01_07002 [Stagonosporopsis vannaccii]
MSSTSFPSPSTAHTNTTTPNTSSPASSDPMTTLSQPPNGSEEQRFRLAEELDERFNILPRTELPDVISEDSPVSLPGGSVEEPPAMSTPREGSSVLRTPPAENPVEEEPHERSVNRESSNREVATVAVLRGALANNRQRYYVFLSSTGPTRNIPPAPALPRLVPEHRPNLSRFWIALQRRRYNRLSHAANEENDLARLVSDSEGPDYNPDFTNVRDELSFAWETSRYSGRLSLPYNVSLTLRTLPHRTLILYRQGRAGAGLDTRELDEELTRRVLLQPQMWPVIYDMMQEAGVLDRVQVYRAVDIERVEDERLEPMVHMLDIDCRSPGDEHERAMLGSRW